MSLAALIDKSEISIGFTPFQRMPSDFSDVVSSSFNASVANYNSNSSAKMISDALSERDSLYRDLTGEDASSIWQGKDSHLSLKYHGHDAQVSYRQELIDKRIQELRAKDPDAFRDLKTYREVVDEAERSAIEAREKFEEDFAFYDGAGKYVAAFLGGLGATALDPLTWSFVAAEPLFVAGKMGQAANASRTILQSMKGEAIAGAVGELAVAPFIVEWQKQLNQEYGIGDVAADVVTGAVFGAGIAGAGRVASEGFYRASKIESLPEDMKAAFSFMGSFAKERETSAIPDINRHIDNTNRASKIIDEEGRMPRTDELNVHPHDIIDPIDPEVRSKLAGIADDDQLRGLVYREVAERLTSLAGNKMTRGERLDLDQEILSLRQEVNRMKREAEDNSAAVEAVKAQLKLVAPRAKAREIKKQAVLQVREENDKAIKVVEDKLGQAEAIKQKDIEAQEAEAMLTRIEQDVPMDKLPDSPIKDDIQKAFKSYQKAMKTPEPRRRSQQTIQDVDDLLVRNNIASTPQVDSLINDLIEDVESPEYQRAIDAELDRMPDDIDFGGDGITSGDFKKRMKAEQAEVDAMSFCSAPIKAGGES